MSNHRIQFTISHLMTTSAIMATAMSFPFASFWVLEVLTVQILGANAMCVVWLLTEGELPYPKPIRFLAFISQHILPLILIVWIASMTCTLRYDTTRGGSVVIGEHAAGLLHSSSPVAETGWHASWFTSKRIRMAYSGGSSSGNVNWESHHYQPLIVPVILVGSLLTLYNSTSTQNLIRNVAKKHNRAVNPRRR